MMLSLLSTIRNAVRCICLLLLAALVVTPLLQIVMRGVFNVPMSGAEELARYFLICLSFVGASYVTHEGGQIRMEEFQVLIPPTPRWLLQMAIELAAVAVFAVFFVASVVTILNNLRNQTPTLEMPFWLFMAPNLRGLRWRDLLLFSHSYFFSCWDFRSSSRLLCRVLSIC
jgi:TRAP-type C4-dicarboxylate transport system permease small subunit